MVSSNPGSNDFGNGSNNNNGAEGRKEEKVKEEVKQGGLNGEDEEENVVDRRSSLDQPRFLSFLPPPRMGPTTSSPSQRNSIAAPAGNNDSYNNDGAKDLHTSWNTSRVDNSGGVIRPTTNIDDDAGQTGGAAAGSNAFGSLSPPAVRHRSLQQLERPSPESRRTMRKEMKKSVGKEKEEEEYENLAVHMKRLRMEVREVGEGSGSNIQRSGAESSSSKSSTARPADSPPPLPPHHPSIIPERRVYFYETPSDSRRMVVDAETQTTESYSPEYRTRSLLRSRLYEQFQLNKAAPPEQEQPFKSKAWKELRSAFEEMLTTSTNRHSYETLYRIAYTMVVEKHGAELYNGVREIFRKHIKHHVLPPILIAANQLQLLLQTAQLAPHSPCSTTAAAAASSSNFLAMVASAWRSYCSSVETICVTLLYMDRIYTPQAGLATSLEAGWALFRTVVVEHPFVYPHIQEVVVALLGRLHGDLLAEVAQRRRRRRRSGGDEKTPTANHYHHATRESELTLEGDRLEEISDFCKLLVKLPGWEDVFADMVECHLRGGVERTRWDERATMTEQRQQQLQQKPDEQTNMDDRFVQSTWEMLKKAIGEIQHKNNSGLSFEELYRNAYTMVLHKHGDKLYSGLQEVVRQHLQEDVRPAIVDSTAAGSFLEELNKAWTDHSTAMVMIRDILMYMDRVYVQQAQVEPVYMLGLRLFRTEVVEHPAINDHLKCTLLGLIEQERKGEVIEWMGVHNACQMLIALGGDSNRAYYESQFESLFLRDSAQFYRHASQKFLEENSASVYVHKVKESLLEESQRAERYLDKTTEARIIDVLHGELITKHMTTVVDMENSGLVHMLLNNQISQLHELYELLKRVPPTGVKTIVETLSRYLRKKGQLLVEECNANEGASPAAAAVSTATATTSAAAAAAQAGGGGGDGAGASNPLTFIQSLINLKEQFDSYLHEAFKDDREIKMRVQSDFEYFLNLSPKSPEYLSLYIDDKLKKGLKTLNEGEAESVLDKAMILFKYLQEKDAFERYYKIHLSKRLLLDRSISDDTEKSMISKLKTECGCQFTSKLEGMFRDMETSTTVINEYREQHGARFDVDLSVRVLTKVYWPTYQSPMCRIPVSLQEPWKQFERFYLSKHNGRKIQLNMGLGTADVKAVFYGQAANDELISQQESDQPGSSSQQVARRREEHKILQVNTHQMCVLMLFNQHSQITFERMANDTEIPEKDLKRALQALAMGKQAQRVLVRRGAGKEIEPRDVFSVNDAFTSKLTRIKIQNVSGKGGETDQQRKETRAKIDDDRKHEIEAAIVRVMKARKKLIHNDLVTEVTNQLKARFMPDPTLIKKRVESLIEREYLKRDDINHKLYHYLA